MAVALYLVHMLLESYPSFNRIVIWCQGDVTGAISCPFKVRYLHQAPLEAAKTDVVSVKKPSVETVKTAVETGLSQQLLETGVETSQQLLSLGVNTSVLTASQR